MRKYVHTGRKSGYLEDQEADRTEIDKRIRFFKNTYRCTVHLDKVKITRVGTLIVATNYLELIQNRYMFRSFTALQCSHQHCVQPFASVVEVVGYL